MTGGDERNVTAGERRKRSSERQRRRKKRRERENTLEETDDREDEWQRKCCREGNTDAHSLPVTVLPSTLQRETRSQARRLQQTHVRELCFEKSTADVHQTGDALTAAQLPYSAQREIPLCSHESLHSDTCHIIIFEMKSSLHEGEDCSICQ